MASFWGDSRLTSDVNVQPSKAFFYSSIDHPNPRHQWLYDNETHNLVCPASGEKAPTPASRWLCSQLSVGRPPSHHPIAKHLFSLLQLNTTSSPSEHELIEVWEPSQRFGLIEDHFSSVFLHHFNSFESQLSGESVFTVIPSQRGDSRDSFMIVFSFNFNDVNDYWVPSVGVALARYLRGVSWMSRDVIVFFSDNSLPHSAGIRAFLDAYHRGEPRVTSHPFPRRGIIRMATALEARDIDPNAVMVDYASIDGMLPNQDLINVIMTEATHANMGVGVPPVWRTVVDMAANTKGDAPHTPFLQ
eukprot:GHVN01020623.1.p1 GENE.GHVN01020623.1~~GHVN01020623.1.p1  ORF type:complete len:302 (+),score=45.32 GHVN01020623.1:253-1158(+)